MQEGGRRVWRAPADLAERRTGSPATEGGDRVPAEVLDAPAVGGKWIRPWEKVHMLGLLGCA